MRNKYKNTCILLYLICFRFENEDSLLEIDKKNIQKLLY